MDNKNVFIAIALSMSVLLFWGAFFETPKQVEIKDTPKQIEKNQGSTPTPSINEIQIIKKISRDKSIDISKRIKIENNNIIGSLTLEGGIIDDVSFKNHKQNLENNKNIEFLNPAQTENGFYVETGWTSIGGKIKVPSKNSIWSVNGNNSLGENKPVILKWNNGEGIIFKKQIELDDKFLFKITQEVQNNTNNQYNPPGVNDILDMTFQAKRKMASPESYRRKGKQYSTWTDNQKATDYRFVS